MSKNLDNILFQFNNFFHMLSDNGKKFYKVVMFKSSEIGNKGKIQIEIEKLKWELKQKYNQLGIHVSDKKIAKSVTDFSHDNDFLHLVNEINKLKLFIEEREREKVKRSGIAE